MIRGFPEDPKPLLITLIHSCRLKGQETERILLSNASLEITHEDHDNWNGGIDTWGLLLTIPLELFIEFEPSIQKIEESILSVAKSLFRGDQRNDISIVTFRAAAADIEPSDVPIQERLSEVTFWQEGDFRVFISHCSSFKEEAVKFQTELATYGISAFVAHQDIEPTREWLIEIEKALDTMDAIVVLLTKDFPQSQWCDHEVGIAIGKKRLVIPVRLGIDPYGFMGKYQGVTGAGKSISELAVDIAEILSAHELTRSRMSDVVIEKFIESSSFIESGSSRFRVGGF